MATDVSEILDLIFRSVDYGKGQVGLLCKVQTLAPLMQLNL